MTTRGGPEKWCLLSRCVVYTTTKWPQGYKDPVSVFSAFANQNAIDSALTK